MPRGRRSVEGKFAAVIDLFLASDYFRGIGKSTQYGWRHSLLLAARTLGDLPVHEVRPRLIQAFLDGLATLPGKQLVARTALRRLESWGVVREHLPGPITTGVEVIGSDGAHEPWTAAEIQTAIQHARPDIARAVALAFNTGQRASDIIKMRWSDLEEMGGHWGINVIQKKTGTELWVPIEHAFKHELDTWERRFPPFMILDGGRQWARVRLTQQWQIERETNPALTSHKERKLVLHGLRASKVIDLRMNLKMTDGNIASFVGMSEKMVARYARKADRKMNNLASIEHIENHRGNTDRTFTEKGQRNQ